MMSVLINLLSKIALGKTLLVYASFPHWIYYMVHIKTNTKAHPYILFFHTYKIQILIDILIIIYQYLFIDLWFTYPSIHTRYYKHSQMHSYNQSHRLCKNTTNGELRMQRSMWCNIYGTLRINKNTKTVGLPIIHYTINVIHSYCIACSTRITLSITYDKISIIC